MEIKPPKASITRSRAGHYTVSVREKGRRVFYAPMQDNLHAAQQKLKAFYESQGAARPSQPATELSELSLIQTHLLRIAHGTPPQMVTSANPHQRRRYTLADAKSDAGICLLALQRILAPERAS